MTPSPQLRALGGDVRILCALIDALIAGCETFEEAWSHRLTQTAILIESDKHEGWNLDVAARTMRQWGAKDQEGIYAAAGLTKRQREVAFMYYDRQLETIEIGKYLRLDAHTVRVHLQNADERLRRLAA
jgi:DNA-binding NarL/FixJ family response regulator